MVSRSCLSTSCPAMFELRGGVLAARPSSYRFQQESNQGWLGELVTLTTELMIEGQHWCCKTCHHNKNIWVINDWHCRLALWQFALKDVRFQCLRWQWPASSWFCTTWDRSQCLAWITIYSEVSAVELSRKLTDRVDQKCVCQASQQVFDPKL